MISFQNAPPSDRAMYTRSFTMYLNNTFEIKVTISASKRIEFYARLRPSDAVHNVLKRVLLLLLALTNICRSRDRIDVRSTTIVHILYLVTIEEFCHIPLLHALLSQSAKIFTPQSVCVFRLATYCIHLI